MMAFVVELEETLRSSYANVINEVKRTNHEVMNGKTLNCDSFEKIITTIKSVLIDGSNNGLGAVDVANNIIYKLLQENFFVYENHKMAMITGYFYLKRQGVNLTPPQRIAVTNDSTPDEIRALTASWLT